MAIARIATYIRNRFHEARGEYREHGIDQIPGFLAEHDALKKDMLAAAHALEAGELRFWVRVLRRIKIQHEVPFRAVQFIVGHMRRLQKGLPEKLQVADLERTLERELRKHALWHAKNAWSVVKGSVTHLSRDEWNERVTDFRHFLKQHGLTYEQAGGSIEEIRALRTLNRKTGRLRGETPGKRSARASKPT